MGSPADAVRARLAARLYSLDAEPDAQAAPLHVAAWHVPGEPVPVAEALAAARFVPFEVGGPWGTPWSTTWFRLAGEVPPGWAARAEVYVDLGFSAYPPGFQAEGLLVRADGTVVRGVHPRQRRVPLAQALAPPGGSPGGIPPGGPSASTLELPSASSLELSSASSLELYVEAAANPTVTSFTASGPSAYRAPDPDAPLYRLAAARLVLPRADVRALVADLEAADTVLACGTAAGADAARLTEVAAAAVRALDVLDADGQGPQAVAAARAALADALAAPAPPDAPALALVAHAHLDTAWLWPLRETVRKAVRTYANVVALGRAEPAMVFAGSQAAQHAWVRDRAPDVWAQVVAAAAEGRWAPVGGMWVEADTLLPSGESLARQLVHGQRFFAAELGREARTGWLPDCFGFSPALPQLLRQAGIDAFVTQKLSWNDTNRFPRTSFWWEGLDGSRVLAHFPPVATYNAELAPDEVARALGRAPDDADGPAAPAGLVPFGFGDGGGGPTDRMVARARATADLAGAPRAVHRDPDAFFADLRGRAADLPTWRGELYLETHRGTYTSQRRTKLGDARCDEALRQAETWCAAAALRGAAAYPYDELDALWGRTLLLQFHDVLPGSSIGRVHREAEAEHAEVLARALALRDAALAALGARTPDAGAPDAGTPDRTAGAGTWDPPAGAGRGGAVLDDGRLRVAFDADGHPVSVRDLAADRELLPPGGRLGLLQVHPDHPTVFDAWNLDRTYLDAAEDVAGAVEVRAAAGAVVVRRAFGASTATATWTLGGGAAGTGGPARLDLILEVDWREDDRVLKLALPLDLRAESHAAGVQHGWTRRALHENTSWERARYEQWFHGFLHVVEGAGGPGGPGAGGYGVGVVAADVHGYDATAAVRADGCTTTRLRPTLLRAPRFPDPGCDRGAHSFAVSLLPGASLAATAAAARAARTALVPPVPAGAPAPVRVSRAGAAAGGGADPAAGPAVDAAVGPVVDAVKLADDRSGDLVVRLHEGLGGRTRAVLAVDVGAPVRAAVRCDLLERPADGAVRGPRVGADGRVVVDLRPFELATLRLRLG